MSLQNHFNYVRLQRDSLNALTEPEKYEHAFIKALEKLLAGNSVDQLLGGYQNADSDPIVKKAADNALFIETMAQLASYYSHPGLFSAAAMAGSLFYSQALSSTDTYTDISMSSQSELTVEDLKQVLTAEQWLALSVYFALPETGKLDLGYAAVAVPRSALASVTGLHPKQVPLALDAGLSLAASMYSNSLNIAQLSTTNPITNLLMIRALFSLAGWLRLIDYADIAQKLLDKPESPNSTNPELWLDVTLCSLRYQWRTTDQNHLATIVTNLAQDTSTDFTNHCVTHLNNTHDLLSLSQETELYIETTLSDAPGTGIANNDDVSCAFLNRYRGCVIIKGPEFLARQWLQAAGNQYQIERRYYAIPDNESIRATSYDTDGTRKEFTDLDSLLTFCHSKKA